MKILFSFILFVGLNMSYAQQKIIFGYDTAGNQTSRVLCLTGCTAKQTKEIKEIEALVEEDLQKFYPEDMISYYPNPVREELYLKWELLDDNKVSCIMVYGLNGQVLKSYSGQEKVNNQTISFQQYPTGIYAVVLNYFNGDQKTIKIIKQ